MKHLIPLILPFYLGCAAPQTEKITPTVIVDVGSANAVRIRANLAQTQEELQFKQVIGKVTHNFEQILRQQKKQSLEGIMSFNNSNEAFSYNYDNTLFCNPEAARAYFGKITFQYYSSQSVDDKYRTTLITLTDVAPFGSVDKVELFVDGAVRTPFYATYEVNPEAEKMYERLVRQLYLELELHSKKNTSWENFSWEKMTKDIKLGAYQRHQDLLQKLLSQKSLSWEKTQIYNPCDL